MNAEGPELGLSCSRSLIVEESVTVPALPRVLGELEGMPPVLATAAMVAFVETTCMASVSSFLAPGQTTVGIHVDLSHIAATPIGMKMTASVELVAVEGRRLRFKVDCRDEKEVIGTGFHDRFIIDTAKFLERLKVKSTA